MKKRYVLTAMFGVVLALGMALVGCDTGTGDTGTGLTEIYGGGGGGEEEELLEVTHVNGFQGKLSNGSLIEIEVASTTDGNQSFTLYINGVNKGTGTLTVSGGSITAIVSSTDSSLAYSYDGVVTYGGFDISLRPADPTVWVHWGVYYGATMNDFNVFAQNYGRDADQMYRYHPFPNDQGYYYGSPSSPVYDTPENIFNQARLDHPSDAPSPSVLNQAISVLNNHRNTGVGAYVSRGNLIAYYFIRVK
ncbi:hypothetical protein AGMMS49942_04480 [Spirochaetia bacterium]|nr:hypothetical protein AGMMS49942_04480 [Spirochaetia bacterium]